MTPIRRRGVFRGLLLPAVPSLLATGPGAGAGETRTGEVETIYFDSWDPATGELSGGSTQIRREPEPPGSHRPRNPLDQTPARSSTSPRAYASWWEGTLERGR